MLLLTGRTWGQLKILCIPVSRSAQMPFKYVTSILTTYFPVAQQKKDIALKCGRHVYLYEFHNIPDVLDGFKVGWHLCLKNWNFIFLVLQ